MKNKLLSPALIHPDLEEARQYIYEPLDFIYSPPVKEKESAEYAACRFEVNGFFIQFRVAKITPTKIGQFVTVWKRLDKGPIQPFDMVDPVDFFVISTRQHDRFGQFVFPKSALCKHDIFSINGCGGKRAMRVYPPWDITVSRQAQKTQQWQMEYFLEIPLNRQIDCARAQKLYLL